MVVGFAYCVHKDLFCSINLERERERRVIYLILVWMIETVKVTKFDWMVMWLVRAR